MHIDSQTDLSPNDIPEDGRWELILRRADHASGMSPPNVDICLLTVTEGLPNTLCYELPMVAYCRNLETVDGAITQYFWWQQQTD